MFSPLRLMLTRRWPSGIERLLAQHYALTVNADDTPLSEVELTDALRSHDIVCPTLSDRITKDVIEAGSVRCRMLCNYGAGVNHIDIEACRRFGVLVTNTPDVLTESTAQIAVLLMLMIARRAGEGERIVRRCAWRGWAPTDLLGSDICGKTLGIIGFGRIGQATARIAHRAFGLNILYFSRRRVAPELERLVESRYCETIEELLQSADVVSLHCPGGLATEHLLNEQRLGLMKPSAFLINTARGAVVDEEALARTLLARRIGGAGLDVYTHEPHVISDLLCLDNVVLLPHLGSATIETREAIGLRVIRNIDSYVQGVVPPDLIQEAGLWLGAKANVVPKHEEIERVQGIPV